MNTDRDKDLVIGGSVWLRGLDYIAGRHITPEQRNKDIMEQTKKMVNKFNQEIRIAKILSNMCTVLDYLLEKKDK